MQGNLELLGYTLVAPFAMAVLVGWLCRKLLPAGAAERYILAIASAVGCALGYVLLPDDVAPLIPERHWQWLAYLAVGASIVGPICQAKGVAQWERWLLYAALSLVTAWQLVPTWDTLSPPRGVLIVALTGYLLMLMMLLDLLPARLRGRLFVGLLTITLGAAVLLVAVEISIKFGQSGAVAAAAFTGCCLLGVALFRARASEPDSIDAMATASAALVPVYVLLTGGLAFMGAVEPQPPRFAFLAVPAAPLAIWLFAVGPLARWKGVAARAMQVGVLVAVLACILAWILLSASRDEWTRFEPRQAPTSRINS